VCCNLWAPLPIRHGTCGRVRVLWLRTSLRWEDLVRRKPRFWSGGWKGVVVIRWHGAHGRWRLFWQRERRLLWRRSRGQNSCGKSSRNRIWCYQDSILGVTLEELCLELVNILSCVGNCYMLIHVLYRGLLLSPWFSKHSPLKIPVRQVSRKDNFMSNFRSLRFVSRSPCCSFIFFAERIDLEHPLLNSEVSSLSVCTSSRAAEEA
jgi:hypothetical protein